MEPLFDIHNATAWRGDTCVFRNFSLTIGMRERVAILGPNGSGKTTLLKLINRELYPVVQENSWVRVLGQERCDVWELRRQIGLVSQHLQDDILPQSTVLEVIVSGFYASHGVHAQLHRHIERDHVVKAEEVMDELALAALWDRPFGRLSTGQQRRALLGRALVHDPAALILDEPTTGLDLSAAFDYMRRMRRWAGSGRGLVLVTHHINEIPPEVDRVVLLKAGNIQADGAPSEVLRADLLSSVYSTPIRIIHDNGFYLAHPA